MNFSQLEFLARDMAHVKEYDFEIVAFKFDENCYFTTRSLYYKLLETNLITARTDLRIMPHYRKNDPAMMLPQLAYMNVFCKFMVSAQTVNALKALNAELEDKLIHKVDELDRIRRDREQRIKALREKVDGKRKVLAEKHQRVQAIRANLATTERFAGEKNREVKYQHDVF